MHEVHCLRTWRRIFYHNNIGKFQEAEFMDSSNSLIWQTVSSLLWTSNSSGDNKPEEITYNGNITSLALEDALGGPLGTLGTFKLRQHLYRCCIKKSKVETTLFHSTVFYSQSSLETIFQAMVEVILHIIRLPHQVSASSFTTPTSGQSGRMYDSPSAPTSDGSTKLQEKSLFEIDAVLLLQWILEILKCNKVRLLQLWSPVQGMNSSFVD